MHYFYGGDSGCIFFLTTERRCVLIVLTKPLSSDFEGRRVRVEPNGPFVALSNGNRQATKQIAVHELLGGATFI